MSFGPGFLSGIFGGDPQKELRKKMMQLMSPQNQAKLTNQFYQQNLGSPAYSQGLSTIAAGANQAGNQVAANLGARGIGTTGTGAILSSLVPSLVGSQQAQLRTGAYNSAQGQAMQTLQQQLAALTGTAGPSQTRQLFGAGLDAFGPMFNSWLMAKYPGAFAQPKPTG